jgi:hypothetical protein
VEPANGPATWRDAFWGRLFDPLRPPPRRVTDLAAPRAYPAHIARFSPTYLILLKEVATGEIAAAAFARDAKFW